MPHRANIHHNPTYYIHTFGCQMNNADSERFRTVIENTGYLPSSDWRKADLIVFNTCSVKQKAEDRVTGMNEQIIDLKRQNPQLRVVLTGCMARRVWRKGNNTKTPTNMSAGDREQELKQLMPWVDIVLETKDFGRLPQRLGVQDIQSGSEILSAHGGAEDYLSFRPKYKNHFQAYVPISTGCDHFCTFCIVPFARGGEVCRPAMQIINEVHTLVQSGYRDINLLGQTVNRWVNPDYDQEIKQGMVANTKIPGLNTNPLTTTELKAWQTYFTLATTDGQRPLPQTIPQDFLQLVQVLDKIPGDWWFTWVSSHPNYMTDELIKFVGRSVKSRSGHHRPYIHFAMQSGSDQILKRMNRRYTYREFSQVVHKLRKHIPGLGLSTDVIVGFPRETEEDFLETVAAARECEFDMIYISEFSSRTGTAAGLLKDDVSPVTKTKWKQHLNDDILMPIALQHKQQRIGRTEGVLVERVDTEKQLLIARAADNTPVQVIPNNIVRAEGPVGQFIQVEITSVTPWAMTGKTSGQ